MAWFERAKMSAGPTDPPQNGEPPAPKPERPEREVWDEALKKIRDIVQPDDLALMAGVKKGSFNIYYDAKLPDGRLGYTNLKTGGIFINPRALVKMLEEKTESAIKGFFWHEAGHHAPDVEKLQAKHRHELVNENAIDAEYKRNPKLAKKYLMALRGLHNALEDIWLESYLSQPPFQGVKRDIASIYSGIKRDSLKGASKPEQLVQLLVGEARYGSDKPISELVDEEVYKAYERLCEKTSSGQLTPMDVMQRTTEFESVFASEAMRDEAIRRKFEIHKKFLAEWLALIRKDAEERAEKQKQQSSEKDPGDGEEGEESDEGLSDKEKEEKKKERDEKRKQRQEKQRQRVQDATEDLLDELSGEAGKYEPKLGSGPEGDKDIPESVQRVLDAIEKYDPTLSPEEKAARDAAEGKGEEKGKEEQEDPRDALERTRSGLQDSGDKSRRRGLAEKYGVSEDIIRRWDEIKQQYAETIRNLAQQFAEVFIDNRKMRTQYSRREGELTPGLEYPYIASVASGEPDPTTFQQQVRDPEFLETEIEFIVDTSGSMGGDKIRYAGDTLVVVIEALQQVREILAGQQMLTDDSEQPLKVGLTTFETEPKRVTTLDEPVSPEKQVKILKAMQPGGGTEESGAIKQVFEEFSSRVGRVAKFIIVISDGYGNKDAVAPLMRNIANDGSVILLALGIGSDANGVISTYLDPVRSIQGHEAVVFGKEAANPQETLQLATDFLKEQLPKYYETHFGN